MEEAISFLIEHAMRLEAWSRLTSGLRRDDLLEAAKGCWRTAGILRVEANRAAEAANRAALDAKIMAGEIDKLKEKIDGQQKDGDAKSRESRLCASRAPPVLRTAPASGRGQPAPPIEGDWDFDEGEF